MSTELFSNMGRTMVIVRLDTCCTRSLLLQSYIVNLYGLYGLKRLKMNDLCQSAETHTQKSVATLLSLQMAVFQLKLVQAAVSLYISQ